MLNCECGKKNRTLCFRIHNSAFHIPKTGAIVYCYRTYGEGPVGVDALTSGA